jgi:type I restriction enzyme S subunit
MKELRMKFRWETEFKETEIGEIPKDWEVKKLGDLLRSLESGSRPKGGSLAHTPNGVLSIGGENINWDGSLNLAECLRFEESFYERLKRGRIEEGDILLVKDGATIGKLAFIKEVPEGKAMVNEHVFLLKSNNLKINSKFLFYFLFSEVGRQQIESLIFGSAQGGINKSIQDNILVFYPPLPEQSRIATVLSWFDDLIEVKKRQNEILEKTAMAIFKSWFIDFEPFRDEEFVYSEELGKEIPKEWQVSPIEKEFYLIKGRKYEVFDDYFEGCSLYLLIETFKTGKIEFWTIEKEPQVEENDVVLVADGESSGKVLRYQKGILGSTLLTLKPKCENSIELKHLIYLTLKFYEDEIMSHRTGSAIPHLDKEFLKSFLLLLPPSHILQSFHSLVEPLFQKIILNQKQIMTLRKIRDTLLPLLVFGKLRVEEV